MDTLSPEYPVIAMRSVSPEYPAEYPGRCPRNTQPHYCSSAHSIPRSALVNALKQAIEMVHRLENGDPTVAGDLAAAKERILASRLVLEEHRGAEAPAVRK